MDIPSERDILQHRRLARLYEVTDGGKSEATRADLAEHFDNDRQSIEWVHQMQQEGLIHPSRRLIAEIRLRAEGVERVERSRDRRRDRSARRAACLRQLLWWANQNSDHADDFRPARLDRQPAGWFEGDYFETAEIAAAAERLTEWGLVKSHISRGHGGVGRVDVAITQGGQECADDFDCDPVAYRQSQQPPPASQHTQTFHGDIYGQVAQGTTVHQTQNVGFDTHELLDLMRGIRDAAAEAPETDRLTVLRLVDQVEEEAQAPEPDPTWVRQLVQRLQAVGGKVGNAALTAAVAAGTDGALNLL